MQNIMHNASLPLWLESTTDADAVDNAVLTGVGEPGTRTCCQTELTKNVLETLQTLTKQCTQVGKINNSIKRHNSQ